jgi:hypothetical protein
MNLVCEQCQKEFLVDELPRRGSVCFGCHIKSIRLGFRQGREEFHGPTIRERQEQIVKDAKINGYNPEPVGTRWV